MSLRASAAAPREAPFRALCGTEAWTESALADALDDVDLLGRRIRRAEAWVVFEDGTYGVFILHEGGERLMYSWEPPPYGGGGESLRRSCLDFARRVVRDPRILPEIRARIRFAIFTEAATP